MEIKTEFEIDEKLDNTEIYLNSFIKTELDSTITTSTNLNATKIKDCVEELELPSSDTLTVTPRDYEKASVNPCSQILEGRRGELNCESEKEGKFGLFKCTECPHTAQTHHHGFPSQFVSLLLHVGNIGWLVTGLDNNKVYKVLSTLRRHCSGHLATYHNSYS
ncbi:uncharacterized protein LOC116172797 isoform X2 [Photinus pyralis]|uniref:uncharacterized protein LOC116172797 isoform X2 n=1 Tax=Photinus pyralis TaxID=7054 RepID=UPI0012672876|nr:uncharacterized protein LOC116172797 isoform X2 [Photinus pyralis]